MGEINQRTKSALKDEFLADIKKRRGLKEYKYASEDNSMNNLQYLRSLVTDIEISLRDHLEQNSSGPMKNWIESLTEQDLKNLKNRSKGKFVIADSTMISRLELQLTNGCLEKDEISFPQGCNMLHKFQQLEQLQSTLKGFCPENKLDDYAFGRKTYLSKVCYQLLHNEYLDDVKRVVRGTEMQMCNWQMYQAQQQHLMKICCQIMTS